jgi:hypothetical protein
MLPVAAWHGGSFLMLLGKARYEQLTTWSRLAHPSQQPPLHTIWRNNMVIQRHHHSSSFTLIVVGPKDPAQCSEGCDHPGMVPQVGRGPQHQRPGKDTATGWKHQ